MEDGEAEKWLKWFLNLSDYCRKYGKYDYLAKQLLEYWRKIDEAFYALAKDEFKEFLSVLFKSIAETVKGDMSVKKAVLDAVIGAHKDVPYTENSLFESASEDERRKYAEKVLKYIRETSEKYGKPYGGVAALKWLMSPQGQAFIPFLWKEKYKVLCVNAFVELILVMFS